MKKPNIEPNKGHSRTIPIVNRFEVIDYSRPEARCYVAWPCKVELVYQDNGRTLKVFVEQEATRGLE